MRLSLLLVLCFSLQTFAEDVTFFYYREQGREEFRSLLDEFEDETGHKVKMHRILTDDLKPALIKSVLAGKSADVVFAPSDIISIAKQAKLSELPMDWVQDSTPAESLDTAKIDGKLMGMPILQGNHLMLFYNKAMVEKVASTWQELLEQKPIFDQKNVETIGWNYSEMYWFSGFYNTFGGRMTKGNKVTLDDPAMYDALHFYRTLATRGLVSDMCDYSCGYQDFVDRRVAYAINGEWAVSSMKQALGDDFGIAEIPKIGDLKFKPMSSTLVLIFPANSLESSKRQALASLTMFFQRAKVQQRIYEEVQFLPVNQSLFTQIQQQADPNLKAMLEQLKYTVPMSPEGAQSSAWIGIQKGFDLYMQGLSNAEEAAKLMQQYAERDYKQNLER